MSTSATGRPDGSPRYEIRLSGRLGPRWAASFDTLSASYDWTFLLSQSLMPAFNALCLGTILYRSGLVPRILPTLGLIGAPLLLASDIAIFFGLYDREAPVAALAALPLGVWEFSLGVYLLVKGFRPSAVAALPPAQAVR